MKNFKKLLNIIEELNKNVASININLLYEKSKSEINHLKKGKLFYELLLLNQQNKIQLQQDNIKEFSQIHIK